MGKHIILVKQKKIFIFLILEKNGPHKGGGDGKTFFHRKMLLRWNDIIPAQLAN